MILFCNDDKVKLEKAEKELALLSEKILTKKQNIKRKNIIKSFLKNFLNFFKLILQKNENKAIYIAVILSGGIGDVLRQKDAVLSLIALLPGTIVDVYSKTYKPFFSDIKKVRFFFDRDLIGSRFVADKYDIVVDYFTSDNVTSGIADLKINNLKNDVLKKFADDFEEIKREYPYCFNVRNQYSFQQKAIKNNLKFNDVAKLTAGIKDFKKINLALNYKEQDITKFGLNTQDKYITFQHGWGDKGYIPGKTCWSTKIWATKNWKKLFENIKKELKDYRIVQVGINSDYVDLVDVNLIGETSYDDICSIIKYSSLHVDTDGCCMHIAEALNVKSVILFGPSDARYVSYDNNINVVSSQCRNCYTLRDWDVHCYREFENKQPVCMESISPDFVAKTILRYMLRQK